MTAPRFKSRPRDYSYLFDGRLHTLTTDDPKRVRDAIRKQASRAGVIVQTSVDGQTLYVQRWSAGETKARS